MDPDGQTDGDATFSDSLCGCLLRNHRLFSGRQTDRRVVRRKRRRMLQELKENCSQEKREGSGSV